MIIVNVRKLTILNWKDNAPIYRFAMYKSKEEWHSREMAVIDRIISVWRSHRRAISKFSLFKPPLTGFTSFRRNSGKATLMQASLLFSLWVTLLYLSRSCSNGAMSFMPAISILLPWLDIEALSNYRFTSFNVNNLHASMTDAYRDVLIPSNTCIYCMCLIIDSSMILDGEGPHISLGCDH